MDDLDQYDSASQYGQGFDDTASMISGYTMRTQKTAPADELVLLEDDELEKLSLVDDASNHEPGNAAAGGSAGREGLAYEQGVIELDGKDDGELAPHACRCVSRMACRTPLTNDSSCAATAVYTLQPPS